MSKEHVSTYEHFKADPKRRRLLVEEELMIEVREKICEYMQLEGITRTELAKRLDVTKGYITQILSGSRNVTLRTLAAVADALGYEVKLRLRRLKQPKEQRVSYQIEWEKEPENAVDEVFAAHLIIESEAQVKAPVKREPALQVAS